jgi:flagellar biosynthesis regulator FlaF
MSFTTSHGASRYRRNLTPKQMEAEVFSRVVRTLREHAPGAGSIPHARAIADTRRLWDAVLASVLDPANQLTPSLRAQIAGLARTVLRECDAEVPDTEFLIEINEQMAGALWN